MWFIKSIQSSKSVQIYFDTFDNKHVRRGGTLAWRCNNPGLVHSHSHVAAQHRAIGHCGQYPVFADIATGRKALISWLRLKSYYSKPLLAIAQFYSPDHPKEYLAKLCHLSDLNPSTVPSNLLPKQFDKLVWAIEELAGGHQKLGDESFVQLPKIIGKFSSHHGKVDHYLVADKRILSKTEALNEVKAEKIDAVVVHRSDGTEYLRSRPGYTLPEIFVSKPEQIVAPNFKDLIRESGEHREGQVIWGFINGILNNSENAQNNLTWMVEAVKGERVWGLINETGLTQFGGLPDALSMKIGYNPEIVAIALEYLHFLISQAKKEHHHLPIIVVAHSEGAMIAELAAKQLEPSCRNKIQFWTFGGASFVPAELCHPNTWNFVNQHDLIVRAVSPIDYRIMIIRDQFKDKNLDFVANLLAQEDMLIEGIDMGPAYDLWEQEKAKKHRKKLAELCNTKIIYHQRVARYHHSFDEPNYQAKLRELINNIYDK